MLNTAVSQQTVETLHEHTLALLERVGVSFADQEALELFRKHGFQVDGTWVSFQRVQLEQALSLAPASFTIQGLGQSVTIGDGRTHFASASGAVEVLAGGRRRNATQEDLVRRNQLEALSPVVDIGDMDGFYLPELPREQEILHKAALALMYNPKPLIANCSSTILARQTLQLAKDFYGGSAPYYALGVANMMSPLRYTDENIGALKTYLEFGQPLVNACCSIPGLTSPVTLSGTLVQNNAEILAGLVYLQLMKPGLPVVYGNSTFGVNMRNANTSCGAFESGLIIPYAAALARYYKLPCRVSGSLTDAKLLDYSAGAETAVGLFYALNSGVDLIYHTNGALDGLMAFSFEKYLLDEEIALRLLHAGNHDMLYGLEESMQDLMKLRQGVNFLSSKQTGKEFKKEHYNPLLSNRERLVEWQKKGSPSIEKKASELLEKRLEDYRPPLLTPEQRQTLERAMAR